MPEISDQELAAARRAVQIIRDLSGNPDARNHLERGLKVIDPKIETTEEATAKLAAPYLARMDELQKRLDERDARETKAAEDRANDDAMARLMSGFERLKAQGLTAEGEEAVKKLMTERTIPDPEAAFALFQQQNPKPSQEQSSWSPDFWNYEKDSVPDTKGLFANPDKWADETIGQVLMEERRKSNDSF